jgi:5-methylcytosine-specific restriction endonuclease McrA
MARLRAAPQRLGRLADLVAPGGASGATTGWQRRDGRSSTARGYGADWRRVRAAVLAAEPLCRTCAAQGRVERATQVDHIEGFAGVADPARLSVGNLQPLCAACHAAKTARAAQNPRVKG